MYIQKETAKKIIQEISTVLDYDINIMNEEGIILASTNPRRVDHFHEAAYKIIHDSLPELMVYYDGEYAGCKKGINLPILLEGNIIGVIGMTGNVDEITKYGRILKKMTEIMTLDIFDLHQKSIRMQKKLFLFHDVMNSNSLSDKMLFQLKKYGLNEKKICVSILYRPSNLFEKQSVKNTLSADLGDIGAAISQLNKDDLEKRLTEIISQEENASIFVGSIQKTYAEIKQSFNDAEKAEEYYIAHKDNRLIFYDDYIIDIVLQKIPKAEKEKCIKKVFFDCSDIEIKEYVSLINIYSTYNGSIKQISDALFIHKNTVQYRINKIQNKTGLDMRNTNHLFQLKLIAKWLTV